LNDASDGGKDSAGAVVGQRGSKKIASVKPKPAERISIKGSEL
jgi:hypothetical protein